LRRKLLVNLSLALMRRPSRFLWSTCSIARTSKRASASVPCSVAAADYVLLLVASSPALYVPTGEPAIAVRFSPVVYALRNPGEPSLVAKLLV
jgi:hypothetical protein